MSWPPTASKLLIHIARMNDRSELLGGLRDPPWSYGRVKKDANLIFIQERLGLLLTSIYARRLYLLDGRCPVKYITVVL